MSNLVDARGLACPQPVISTKKALEEIESGTLIIIVDNDVAKENISRFAKSFNYPVEIEEKENLFYITITKEKVLASEGETSSSPVFLITSQYMGQGSDQLGKVLMASFFFAVTESNTLPKAIIFINSGVFLTCEGSSVIEEVAKLESKGVEIISCGACLEHYRLKDKLSAGIVSNMYTIVELMMNNKLISI